MNIATLEVSKNLPPSFWKMRAKTMTTFSQRLIPTIAAAFCLLAPARFATAQEDPASDESSAAESPFRDFDMNRYTWKNRPVLLFAPKVEDKRFQQMKQQVNTLKEGIEDREIVVIEILQEGQSKAEGRPLPDDKVTALRKQYDIEPDKFALLLVGKDGGIKARWFEPIDVKQIFGNIDAMPMRQREMRERGTPGNHG